MYSQKNSNFLRIFWISVKRQYTKLSVQTKKFAKIWKRKLKFQSPK